MQNYQIDSLDRKILNFLQIDARTPFLEIARALKVSGGTIHARVKKLKDLGIIEGQKAIINPERLGLKVLAFVGITVARAGVFRKVVEALEKIPEVTEVHYTTGSYSLFLKVLVPTIQDLHVVISEKIQMVEEIRSTETFIVLNTPIDRDIDLRRMTLPAPMG